MPDPTMTGVWFNKRGLLSVELPPRCQIRSTDQGYAVIVVADGRLTVVHSDKGRQSFDLKAGDELRSGGEEFFLHRSPGA